MKYKDILLKSITIIFLPLLIIYFASCGSKNLDREKAKKMIIDKHHYPKLIKEQLNYGELLYGNVGEKIAEEKNRALSGKNLINFEYIRQESDMFFTYDVYNVTLTSEGEKYRIGQGNNSNGIPYYLVKGGEKDFGEITGIKENEDNSVTVQYTVVFKNITEFGTILGENSYFENQTTNMSSRFTKYDDGWRIEN